MARFARRLVALLLIAGAPALAQEPQVRRALAPRWTDWLPLPCVNPIRERQAIDGIYDLLVDDQVRQERGLTRTFHRAVVKVMARKGLEEGAQEKIGFDPAYEHLVLHRAAVWRDGRMIDQTRAAAIELIRQERDLDSGIINGERTALLRLADVRVGDVVDLAWSWDAHRSAWPGRYAAEMSMGWTVPVAVTRYRLTLPADAAFHGRQSRGLAQPAIWRDGGEVVREWRVDDPAPVRGEGKLPAWWRYWPRVEVSTARDWAEVAAWATRHFSGSLALPPAFAARADAIARTTRDPGARAIAALRLVQDEIRYTSLSIGDGGFVPRTPSEVVASGWGDCKDKSQLLVAVLRRLGIAAWPALTDSDQGAALPTRLPGGNLFDHAIVLASIGGRDHWFDATGSYQGGTLATIAPPAYAWGLPLRAGQDRLVAIPNPVPARPTIDETATYRTDPTGMTLTVATRYEGDEADIKRADLAKEGIADTERTYLDFYRKLYPGLAAAGEMAIADDRDANRLVVTEKYRLPASAKGYAGTLADLGVRASVLRDVYEAPSGDDEGRSGPVRLPWTIHRHSRVVLDMPGRIGLLPDLTSSDGPAFRLVATTGREGERATLDWTLTGKRAWIGPADLPAFRDQLDALDGSTALGIDAGPAMGLTTAWAIIALFVGGALFAVLAVFRRRRVPARNESVA